MKKYVSLILIVVVSVALGIAIHCCYINLDINSTEEATEVEYKYIQYTVVNKEFEENITNEGEILVTGEREYIDQYYMESDENGYINVYAKKGDVVKEGNALGVYVCGGTAKTITSKSYGKIVNIASESENAIVIEVLNYEKLYFTCYLKYSDAKKIDYDTPVYYRVDSGDTVKCKVDFIGYEINEDGNIEIHVVPNKPRKYLPGEKRKIYFVLSEKENYLAVKNDAVVNQNGNCTVLIQTGENEYEEKDVKVGSLLEYREDDHVFYYYKILSGLKEGDLVYSRKVAAVTNESD